MTTAPARPARPAPARTAPVVPAKPAVAWQRDRLFREPVYSDGLAYAPDDDSDQDEDNG
ncbi:hypothetical protein P1P75_37495 [Streptomyces sp. ID05-39B]|uniref:hypothetical protein n=1 Tax=Streptomyces sp. ID05-39B TaxID=3028664 RepID=UPI0029A07A73|nr:hypothetical protein [Streptomyces sp. ID05-39B]MDX3531944.1 hypothetical protein [Streptomyces sp. ID05-39B]